MRPLLTTPRHGLKKHPRTPCLNRRAFLRHTTWAGAGLAFLRQSSAAQAAPRAAPPYTVQAIADRLGISITFYQRERLGAKHIAAIRAAGIRRIELIMKRETFDFRNRAQVSEVLQECQQQQVAVVSVHGNLQREHDDANEMKRRVAAHQLLDEIRFAEEAGAGILVAHLVNNDQSRNTVTELLEQTQDLRIRLTVENMGGGLKPYAAFVDKIGSPRFGLTVDIGHARDPDGIKPFVKRGRAGVVLAEGGRRVWHLHLHETFRLKTHADHRAPLHPDGIIEWGEVFAGLRAITYRGVFLFEDGRGEETEECVRRAAAFPQSFVKRYSQSKSQQ